MRFFHSHCKECNKPIRWGWEFCSPTCENAEKLRYIDYLTFLSSKKEKSTAKEGKKT